MKISVPGAAWTALALALAGVLGGWFTEYVESPLVPLVVLALNLIAKAVEIQFTQPKPEVLAASVEPERSTVSRLLLG